MKKKIFQFLIISFCLIQSNCITLAGIKIGGMIDGKSKNAETIIQGCGFLGLTGDIYAATLMGNPAGLAYGVLSALFYFSTDGGISDRIGTEEGGGYETVEPK